MNNYGVKKVSSGGFVVTNSLHRGFTVDMSEIDAVAMAARMNKIRRVKGWKDINLRDIKIYQKEAVSF